MGDIGILNNLEIRLRCVEAKGEELSNKFSSTDSKLSLLINEFKDLQPLIHECAQFQKMNQNQVTMRIPQINFPKFEGTEVKSWIKSCEWYCQLYKVIQEIDKVLLAAMHMEGRAKIWVQHYYESLEGVSWKMLTESLLKRFLPFEDSVLGDFRNLQQTSSVAEYLEKFEDLKVRLWSEFRGLTEEYFLHSFIAGLKKELKGLVNVFEPVTLREAARLAILQEASWNARLKEANKVKFAVTAPVEAASTGSAPATPAKEEEKKKDEPEEEDDNMGFSLFD